MAVGVGEELGLCLQCTNRSDTSPHERLCCPGPRLRTQGAESSAVPGVLLPRSAGPGVGSGEGNPVRGHHPGFPRVSIPGTRSAGTRELLMVQPFTRLTFQLRKWEWPENVVSRHFTDICTSRQQLG